MAIKEQELNPAALAAISRNDALALKSMLSAGHPLGKDGKGRSLLCVSAIFANAECLMLLLKVSNPRSAGIDGQTPLMRAASNPDAACVKMLLPLSDAKAQDRHGVTALMLAAIEGNAKALKLLLPHSDPFTEDHSGRTAFEYAVGCAYLLDEDGGLAPWGPAHECVEALAEHSSIEQKEVAIHRLGEERLPKLCAALEADILRREVKAGAHLEHKKTRGSRAL